jgi:hypothetical protein
MNVTEAIEVRDRAISLGLEECCDDCREAIARLDKLGLNSGFTLYPKVPNPTYPQYEREATVGPGSERAVRYLRRRIAEPR